MLQITYWLVGTGLALHPQGWDWHPFLPAWPVALQRRLYPFLLSCRDAGRLGKTLREVSCKVVEEPKIAIMEYESCTLNFKKAEWFKFSCPKKENSAYSFFQWPFWSDWELYAWIWLSKIQTSTAQRQKTQASMGLTLSDSMLDIVHDSKSGKKR